MGKYEIAGTWEEAVMIRKKVPTNSYGGWKHQYFAGYDFMGSTTWQDDFSFDKAMSLNEARQIVKDLEAADSAD